MKAKGIKPQFCASWICAKGMTQLQIEESVHMLATLWDICTMCGCSTGSRIQDGMKHLVKQ
jgi:hypothetical protein